MKKVIFTVMLVLLVGALFCDYYYIKVKSPIGPTSCVIRLTKTNGSLPPTSIILDAYQSGIEDGWAKWKVNVGPDWEPNSSRMVTAKATLEVPMLGTHIRIKTFYTNATTYLIGEIDLTSSQGTPTN